MKSIKGLFALVFAVAFSFSWAVSNAGGQDYSGNEDPNKKILKQGLLGAGVGAISAEASGGKAGTGALVGAGTNVIGGALLDTLTAPSTPKPQAQQVQYVQAAPVQQYSSSYPVQTQGYQQSYQPAYQQEPVYVQQQPVYYQQAPQQEDPNKKIIKQGLLGAGVGAISASASGGKAGKGALIGAGTNVIGGALLDSLMGGGSTQQQQAPQPVYYQQAPQQQQYYSQPQYTQQQSSNKCKQVTYYDGEGNPVKTVEEC